MPRVRLAIVMSVMTCFLAPVFLLKPIAAFPSPTATEEKALWDLEHHYWGYVEANDLNSYSALWHKEFLGWPWISAEPVRKDHITDWITSQTAKGLVFKSIEFKSAAIQITGNIAVIYYRETYKWQDKDGQGTPQTTRITHTWVKEGNDWHIIGGMSSLEPGTPKH